MINKNKFNVILDELIQQVENIAQDYGVKLEKKRRNRMIGDTNEKRK